MMSRLQWSGGRIRGSGLLGVFRGKSNLLSTLDLHDATIVNRDFNRAELEAPDSVQNRRFRGRERRVPLDGVSLRRP